MGRPTKLTPELKDRFLQAVRGGNFRCVAAKWCGVSAKIIKDWMARGEKEKKGIYHEFRAAVLEAEAGTEIRMVAMVMKAAAEDPDHAWEYLWRKFPQRWAKNRTDEKQKQKGDPPVTETDYGDGITDAEDGAPPEG